MQKKFLLNLDENKLKGLDIYCKKVGISRTSLIKEIVNERFGENKVKNKILQHVMYLDEYRESPMYVQHMQEILKEKKINAISYKDQENLKLIADSLAETGAGDFAIMLKDLSHWQRFLEKNPDNQKTFLEYVGRKYSNENLLTY